MNYFRIFTRISIAGSLSVLAGQVEDCNLEVVAIEVVGSVHVAHVAKVTPGSVHHGLSLSRSLAIVVAVVSLLHTVSVPHVTGVHVVHVPVVVPVVHVVHVVPVVSRVHGPVVTIGVTIAIVAVVSISISFSSRFRGCQGSKADL